MDRKKQIIRTSVIGIVANVLLVAFKAFVGIITNSVAIILDAVNNFSDALSSVVTIIGTALSGKAPDKKHPYGYGRIEYLTSVFVAVLVLVAGVTALKESIETLIHPSETHYTVVSLVIVGVAVLAKAGVGLYFKAVGKKINSGSLTASGTDALFDAILSLATLAGGIVSLLFGLNLEGILGLVISVFIIKAGFEILKETLSSIIGERADSELTKSLTDFINSFPEVRGTYDLILHNYGPAQNIGSVHVELDDDLTAADIHTLTNRIAGAVYEKFNIILTVGIYASCTSSEELSSMREYVESLVSENPAILQMHGFHGDMKAKTVNFDIIIDFKADAQKIKQDLIEKLKAKYPDYTFIIIQDKDFSD